ncbi:MAG: hypothetical protein ABIB61_04920 [Candidatus Shapirobacteria bacterium]
MANGAEPIPGTGPQEARPISNLLNMANSFFNPDRYVVEKLDPYLDLKDAIKLAKESNVSMEDIRSVILPQLQKSLALIQGSSFAEEAIEDGKWREIKTKLIGIDDPGACYPYDWGDIHIGNTEPISQVIELVDALGIGSELFDCRLPARVITRVNVSNEDIKYSTEEKLVDVSGKIQSTLSSMVNCLIACTFPPGKGYMRPTTNHGVWAENDISNGLITVEDLRPEADKVAEVVTKLNDIGFKFNPKMKMPSPDFWSCYDDRELSQMYHRFRDDPAQYMIESVSRDIGYGYEGMGRHEEIDYVEYLEKVTAPKLRLMKLLGIEIVQSTSYRSIEQMDSLTGLFGKGNKEWWIKENDGQKTESKESILKLFDYLIAKSLFVKKYLPADTSDPDYLDQSFWKVRLGCQIFTCDPAWIVDRALAFHPDSKVNMEAIIRF